MKFEVSSMTQRWLVFKERDFFDFLWFMKTPSPQTQGRFVTLPCIYVWMDNPYQLKFREIALHKIRGAKGKVQTERQRKEK